MPVGVPWWLNWLSIWLLVLAQVMISQFVSLSPVLGSMLSAWDSVSLPAPPLSLCFSPAHALSDSLSLCLSLCLSKTKQNKKRKCYLSLIHRHYKHGLYSLIVLSDLVIMTLNSPCLYFIICISLTVLRIKWDNEYKIPDILINAQINDSHSCEF